MLVHQPSPNHHHILELLTAAFPDQRPLTVIDYGCGDGALLRLLPPARLKRYSGFDISQAAVERAANQASPHLKLFNQSRPPSRPVKLMFHHLASTQVPSLGRKNSADAVIAIGVLQYLDDDQLQQFFHQARRVLKPDGKLIISTTANHAVYRWISLYRWLLPHRWYRREELTTACQRVGLNIENIHQKGLIIGPLFSNVIAAGVDGLDKILFRTSGQLGPLGKLIRNLIRPLLFWEYSWPIDYGYTLFLTASSSNH